MSSAWMRPAPSERSSTSASATPPATTSATIAPTRPVRRAMNLRMSRPSLMRCRSVVVGLVAEDLVGAVDLLEQHHARELVRQRHRPERQPVVDAVQLDAAEGAADDEPHV